MSFKTRLFSETILKLLPLGSLNWLKAASRLFKISSALACVTAEATRRMFASKSVFDALFSMALTTSSSRGESLFGSLGEDGLEGGLKISKDVLKNELDFLPSKRVLALLFINFLQWPFAGRIIKI